jgi:hypothetical protein
MDKMIQTRKNVAMANFSRIDAKHQELQNCPRCHCEIQQGDTRCMRCGLLLDPVVVWMIERRENS